MASRRYLIDTNIFILLFKGRLSQKIPEGELFCSFITEMELLSYSGLLEKEEELLRGQLDNLLIYDIEEEIKEIAQ